ncbi:MAG TPA: aspartate aminotransferase family protein [Spirochaetota bacterium]|nr:aspartate aminotransferase family protein [Spirochaetota bacterium]HOS33350.1 aspartate aminotransferase family protein [Spirochaetota bacterium]HOS56122.1 aspartate aminotransferase family protein [Spirochaetota bacterium]HQF77654.1 aspartate aminotransferase family protein [Spirochaetota bacterium]HQH29830.1 aspartate aminotransferase family protein [Spirochaetota bacterium]
MNIIEDYDKYIMKTYARFPLVFTRGEGAWLYTDSDKKILDMSSGIAVSSLGHKNSGLIGAIKKQCDKLLHTSNLYYSEPCLELAKKLIDNSIFAKAFFCNSGAEANEAAIKLSRKYGNSAGSGKKYKILTMKNSFHGRTIATLTATGQTKYQKGFEPLLEGFDYVEFNNVDDMKSKFSSEVAAVIIELVQGEGGIITVDYGFLKETRALCDKYNAIMIFDEIQTGCGRTGKLFGYEHFPEARPDIVTLAKGLAGGVPIGAMLVNDKYCDVLLPGEHASTFGGNLLASAAACEVIDALLSNNMLENIAKTGEYFREKLNELKSKYTQITDVRGIGLMNCIEVNMDCRVIIQQLIENGVLTVPSGTRVIRFLPPLIIKKEEIDFAIGKLEEVFSKGSKVES